MTVETLGIDIAKNVFQLHGVNHHGCVVLKRRLMRDQLLDMVEQVERCTIVVESCTGAFCWARKFEALGRQVKIISPRAAIVAGCSTMSGATSSPTNTRRFRSLLSLGCIRSAAILRFPGAYAIFDSGRQESLPRV